MHDEGEPAALETRKLNKSFGRIEVACDIDFRLRLGARHALIGPNGAGKTTFIQLLTGALAPSSGAILLNGEDISGLSVYRRVKKGIARTFQLNTLLRALSVLENVQLAIIEREGAGGALFGGRRVQREAAETAYAILETLHIEDRADAAISNLPYGQQRLVEIAIALALQPKVLLLDEPAAGVPPADAHLVFETLATLPRTISVVIIEHDMKLVFGFAERISVLVQGRILREGTPSEIANDELVRDVYLGRSRTP
ncbi:ABC transporter ATP-binding protein [Pseudorhodoplanes sp.]|uniref:ABC transporter ATP-binding protein n=1 Tax=Pseudorhodoplanes sp. TaxID=1934341 RepID=UPI003D0DFE47